MAEQFSFDVVSEVDMQEMKNVVDQATKEIKQRFDFKDSKTEITLKEKEKELVLVSDDEYKLNAVNRHYQGQVREARGLAEGVHLWEPGAGAGWDGAPGGEDSKWYRGGQGERGDEGHQGVQTESAGADSRRASARAEQEQG